MSKNLNDMVEKFQNLYFKLEAPFSDHIINSKVLHEQTNDKIVDF